MKLVNWCQVKNAVLYNQLCKSRGNAVSKTATAARLDQSTSDFAQSILVTGSELLFDRSLMKCFQIAFECLEEDYFQNSQKFYFNSFSLEKLF